MKDYWSVPRDIDQGGVHLNMGIPNKAAALIGQKLGREKMAQIYIDAMREYMGPRSTMDSTARATFNATAARYGADSKEAKAVIKAWDTVGLVAKPS
jgi:Zn-dependent metalloprotease